MKVGGDLDTWGSRMLARARLMHEGVKPFLMIEAVYDTHSTQSAVPEPVRAQDIPPVSLTATEASLFKKLVHSPRAALSKSSPQGMRFTQHWENTGRRVAG